MSLSLAPLAAFFLVAASLPAAAGVVLTSEQKGHDEGGQMTAQLDGQYLRVALPGGGAVIWRGDRDAMWRIDDEEHSYTEITRKDMQAMGAQMNAAMAQMRQQMANMPEAQRKRIEQMMANNPMMGGAGAPAPEVTFRKGAAGRKVGAWSCDEWERLVNGKKTDLLCVAKLSDLGLKREDLKPFSDMAAFARELTGQMGPSVAFNEIDPDKLSKTVGYDAYPVRVQMLANGGEEVVLKSVERRTIAPATFEVPTGYAKHQMPMPGKHAQ